MSTMTGRGIHCGSCHDYHESIAEVRACSQRRHGTIQSAADYRRSQASLADGERTARRIEEAFSVEDDRIWDNQIQAREIEDDQRAAMAKMDRWAAEAAADDERDFGRIIPDEARAAQSRWDRARAPRPASRAGNAKERPTADEHAGMYRRPSDGAIWKVQKAVHGSGHLYAKRLVSPSKAGGEDFAPYFEMDSGAIYKIELAWRMTIEEAKQYGALYGVCCVCARTLTDETSIANGIGPACAKKV